MSLSPRQSFLAFAQGLRQSGQVVYALFLRETKTRFGDRRLGILWAFLESALHTLFFVAIRSFFGMTAPAGIPMPIYLFSGIVPFFMFQGCANQVMQCVAGNKALLIFPQVRVLDFVWSRALLEYVTMTIVLWTLVLGMVLLGYDIHIENPLLVLVCFFMFLLMGIGMGLVLLCLNARYDITRLLWQQIGRILYFSSGVIITIDRIPLQYHDELAWNPLLQLVEMMRTAFFSAYDTSDYFGDWFYVAGWILVLWLIGLVMLRKLMWWILASK
jgi:capsular polysaccharide transport system permease protein